MTSLVECIDANDMEMVLGILSPKSPTCEVSRRVAEAKLDFGMVEYEKFRQWISKSDIYMIVSKFDRDGSGHIDVEEMAHLFHVLDPSWTSEKLQHVLREANLGGDGKIPYQEFLTWVFIQASEMSSKENIEPQTLDYGVADCKAEAECFDALLAMPVASHGYAGSCVVADAEEKVDPALSSLPASPVRSSSRQLLCDETLTDVAELAQEVVALDPSMTEDEALKLIENAQRSLVVFPAV